ncbi:hypothetical protein COEREDRAFT_11571 [Coemansia reversa NRRL 1564]|uniref:Uncharacterized protein n=1 Tax=Coemansia reversa (strain ATCC 12441 / NRRL 1564) TaxID=763665 RepID=A0A2G5B2U3_COERN|nr:hypothetical protein COEREDRAFT_11571 [Coemansia reversa NRRL 1564]|eukprot:PIA13342.1 hypothetical protein COEREDRAFT_11571 [Coemansia reversa NRRL 1564]
MSEFYTFLCDTFLQSEYEANVFEVIRSGKIFKNTLKCALGTYVLEVYKNLNQLALMNAAQIAQALFNKNYLPFMIKESVPAKVSLQRSRTYAVTSTESTTSSQMPQDQS